MDVGAHLRESREARGLSLDSITQRTRVQTRILAAIEVNDLRSIPPKPSGRAFVRAYAREVGLDPEETVRAYFAQFAPPPGFVPPEPVVPREPVSSRHWVWGAASAAVLLVVTLYVVRGDETTSAGAPDEAVGTSGTAAPASLPASSAGVTETRTTAEPERAAPAAAPSELTVTISATGLCWITATADGEREVYRLLESGARETLHAKRELMILAGNAGALALTINGRDLGAFGKPGQVRSIRITPENAGSVR